MQRLLVVQPLRRSFRFLLGVHAACGAASRNPVTLLNLPAASTTPKSEPFTIASPLGAWTEASDIEGRASITREVMDARWSSSAFRRLAALFPSV